MSTPDWRPRVPPKDSSQSSLTKTLIECSAVSADGGTPLHALGVAKSKRRIDRLDSIALLVSCICCALAILSIARNDIAWRLTVTNQITVIGFLLSIMNLCLGRVAPFLYLLLEARFGRSTLQNFDGILLNQAFTPRLDFLWRFVLLTTLALPILLSVAYKTFQVGGESTLAINASAVTGLPALYGLYSVPEINTIRGNNMALSLYFNASLPFREASSPPIGMNGPGPEPALPAVFPQTYGANTVLLGEQSTAMLDLPHTSRLMALQDSISIEESLNITANVHGSIAVRNTSLAVKDDPDFSSACFNGTMALVWVDLFIGFSANILSPASTADQSHIWIGLVPDRSDDDGTLESRCTWFSNHAKRYDISRQDCQGSWSVTRGGITLTSGSCSGTRLPRLQQYIYKVNTFFLGNSWLPILAESIGLFATQRNQSAWLEPTMTTTVAAMLWSSAVGMNGIGNVLNQSLTRTYGFLESRIVSLEEAGLLYPLEDEIVLSTRKALVRSLWLYLALAVQPLLALAAVIASILMHSTPIDRGFGLISILAGVDRRSLGVLNGASLSGELTRDARLSIYKSKHGQSVEYTIDGIDEHRRVW